MKRSEGSFHVNISIFQKYDIYDQMFPNKMFHSSPYSVMCCQKSYLLLIIKIQERKISEDMDFASSFYRHLRGSYLYFT